MSYKKDKGWFYRYRKSKKKSKKLKSNLNETKRRKREHKSEEQENKINNRKKFYKAREKLSRCLMIIIQLYLMQNMK